jgi:hypothetical protein
MELAGIAVDRLAVLGLAERFTPVNMDVVELLLIADASGDERVGLSIKDREAVIDVLGDDVPETLAELHVALVTEHMSRTLGNRA